MVEAFPVGGKIILAGKYLFVILHAGFFLAVGGYILMIAHLAGLTVVIGGCAFCGCSDCAYW